MDPSLRILKLAIQVTKSLSVTVFINGDFYMYTHAELPTSYHVQKLKYRAHAPQLKLHIHFTKSPKHDNMYIICV